VLIPSIDLMAQIVQLVQGRKKALEFDNSNPGSSAFRGTRWSNLSIWTRTIGHPEGRETIAIWCVPWCSVFPARWAAEFARLKSRKIFCKRRQTGRHRIVVIRNGAINTAFAEELATQIGADNLVFAVGFQGWENCNPGWRQ